MFRCNIYLNRHGLIDVDTRFFFQWTPLQDAKVEFPEISFVILLKRARIQMCI